MGEAVAEDNLHPQVVAAAEEDVEEEVEAIEDHTQIQTVVVGNRQATVDAFRLPRPLYPGHSEEPHSRYRRLEFCQRIPAVFESGRKESLDTQM